MDSVLINFRLMGDEAKALRKLAGKEFRRPAEQVMFLLRRKLEQEGYLTPDPAFEPHSEAANNDHD